MLREAHAMATNRCLCTKEKETMLGEQLGVLVGKVTGQRILPSSDAPRVETTFEISGKFAGVDSTWMGTYWAMVRPDGSLYGECPLRGVVMTAGGVGTWTAAGAGWFTGEGSAANFRGAIYLIVPPPPLAHLTRSALIYEWDVDANLNAKGTFWDWK